MIKSLPANDINHFTWRGDGAGKRRVSFNRFHPGESIVNTYLIYFSSSHGLILQANISEPWVVFLPASPSKKKMPQRGFQEPCSPRTRHREPSRSLLALYQGWPGSAPAYGKMSFPEMRPCALKKGGRVTTHTGRHTLRYRPARTMSLTDFESINTYSIHD